MAVRFTTLTGQPGRLTNVASETIPPTPTDPGRATGSRRGAAVHGTRADGDGGQGATAHLPDDIAERAPANGAVDPVVPDGDGPLHDGEIAARCDLLHVATGLLGGRAGASHERLVVLDRDQVEEQFCRRRVRSLEEGPRLSPTPLAAQPDHGDPRRRRDRCRDPRRIGHRQGERRCHRCRELEEGTARHPPSDHRLVQALVARAHAVVPVSGRPPGPRLHSIVVAAPTDAGPTSIVTHRPRPGHEPVIPFPGAQRHPTSGRAGARDWCHRVVTCGVRR